MHGAERACASEEEIFYPEVKAALKDHELVPEATVEHASLRDLIAQVEMIEPDGEMYDAKVQVLSEYGKHHVKEEQNEMFPKVESSSLDLVELGARMAARKAMLLAAKSLSLRRRGRCSGCDNAQRIGRRSDILRSRHRLPSLRATPDENDD